MADEFEEKAQELSRLEYQGIRTHHWKGLQEELEKVNANDNDFIEKVFSHLRPAVDGITMKKDDKGKEFLTLEDSIQPIEDTDKKARGGSEGVASYMYKYPDGTVGKVRPIDSKNLNQLYNDYDKMEKMINSPYGFDQKEALTLLNQIQSEAKSSYQDLRDFDPANQEQYNKYMTYWEEYCRKYRAQLDPESHPK